MKNGEETKKNVNKIRHKAEATRHFSRYKIPAYIEIEGKRYKLEDWSVAGCGIIDLPEEIRTLKWAKVNFICPFDVFETIIKDIKVEFLYRKGNTTGCRFTDLKPEQLSLLQDIIEAYLEGSIESIDNFINVIKREDLRESIEARRPKPPKKQGFEETLRKIFVFSILTVIVILLFIFLLRTLYTRVFLIDTVNAFFDANLSVIRVPVAGTIRKKKDFKEGDKINKKEIIAVVNTALNPPVIISSPVNGIVYSSKIRDFDTVIIGDPILTVLPKGEKIFITATILHKDFNRIRKGLDVVIIKNDNSKCSGKIVEINCGPYLSSLHSITNPPTYATSWNYDKIKIAIDFPVKINELKNSVSVKIDLSPEFLKPIFNFVEP